MDALPEPYGDELRGISQATDIALGKFDIDRRFILVDLQAKLSCTIFSTNYHPYVRR